MGLAAIDPTKTIDHYDMDDGDASTPIYIPYVVPALAAGIIKVTFSWLRKPFRSTINLNPSAVGASTGHTHSHGHTIHILNNPGGGLGTVQWGGNGFPLQDNFSPTGDTSQVVNANANAESGHSHALTGAGVQAVTEGPTANITALSLDGVDYTGALGGPWLGDMVELDISSQFKQSSGAWHQIALSLNGLGRVVSLLRIYYTS